MQKLRIGLIGLDTIHAVSFTKSFNDPSSAGYREDGVVVAGWSGGSADMPLSRDRVEGYTTQLRDQYGIKILPTPEEVAEACDLLFITSIDARIHLELLRRTIKYRRPTFIDKAVAQSSTDARQMFDMAREAGIPLMACSPLRYAEELDIALANGELGKVTGCDVFGPGTIVEIPPGLFWYGIHVAEVVYTVMGAGCAYVQSVHTDNTDTAIGVWKDGRIATMRAQRKTHPHFGVTVHREKGPQQMRLDQGERHFYDRMLDGIMRSLPHGKSDIPDEQTLEMIRFIEAANESRQTGLRVTL